MWRPIVFIVLASLCGAPRTFGGDFSQTFSQHVFRIAAGKNQGSAILLRDSREPQEAYFVTCYHVLAGADSFEIFKDDQKILQSAHRTSVLRRWDRDLVAIHGDIKANTVLTPFILSDETVLPDDLTPLRFEGRAIGFPGIAPSYAWQSRVRFESMRNAKYAGIIDTSAIAPTSVENDIAGFTIRWIGDEITHPGMSGGAVVDTHNRLGGIILGRVHESACAIIPGSAVLQLLREARAGRMEPYRPDLFSIPVPFTTSVQSHLSNAKDYHEATLVRQIADLRELRAITGVTLGSLANARTLRDTSTLTAVNPREHLTAEQLALFFQTHRDDIDNAHAVLAEAALANSREDTAAAETLLKTLDFDEINKAAQRLKLLQTQLLETRIETSSLQGNWEAVVRDATTLISVDAENWYARLACGNAYRALGKLDDAVSVYSQIVSSLSTREEKPAYYFRALINRSTCFFDQNKRDLAWVDLESAGRYSMEVLEGVAVADRAIDLGVAWMAFGNAFCDANQLNDSVRAFEEGIRLLSRAEAIDHSTNVLRLLAKVRINHAVILCSLGKLEEAEAELAECKLKLIQKTDPLQFDASIALAQCYRRSGKVNEAIDVLNAFDSNGAEKGLSVEQLTRIRLELSDAFIAGKQWQRACDAAGELVRLLEGNGKLGSEGKLQLAAAQCNLGIAYRKLRKPNEAMHHLAASSELYDTTIDDKLVGPIVQRNQAKAFYNFVGMLPDLPDLDKNNKDRGYDYARRSIELLQALRRGGDGQGAESASVTLDLWRAFYNRSALRFKCGKAEYEAAINDLDAGLASLDRLPTEQLPVIVNEMVLGHVHRAYMNFELGRYPTIISDIKEIGHLTTDSSVSSAKYAAQLCAWMLATCPDENVRSPNDAMKWARIATKKADEGDPSYFDVLDVLATVQAANGDYQGAIENERQALKLVKMARPDSDNEREIASRLDLFRQNMPFVSPRPRSTK
jgi:tetratricopeptide (TPR) repeat protein